MTKRLENANDATHAGGIVFRFNEGGAPEFLVIHPNLPQTAEEKKANTPRQVDLTQRVFPKGHIEHGESHAEAALREVLEEAGIVARPVCLLGMVSYQLKSQKGKKDKEVRVKFYLMEFLAERELEEGDRDPQFLTYAQAKDELTHPESLEMLEIAKSKLESDV